MDWKLFMKVRIEEITDEMRSLEFRRLQLEKVRDSYERGLEKMEPGQDNEVKRD
jgi:hypothetical protein